MDCIEKLENIKRELLYVNEMLNCSLENWERKEYEGVREDYEIEIKRLEKHIFDNPTVFK